MLTDVDDHAFLGVFFLFVKAIAWNVIHNFNRQYNEKWVSQLKSQLKKSGTPKGTAFFSLYYYLRLLLGCKQQRLCGLC